MNDRSPRTTYRTSARTGSGEGSRSRQRSRSGRSIGLVLAATLGVTAAAACDRSSTSSSANPSQNAGAKEVTLVIASNAISGGKNADEADWFANYVIPKFTAQEKAKGVNVKVKFQPSGVDDEQYKTKLALDLKSRSGADIVAARRHLGRRVRPGRLHQAARPGRRRQRHLLGGLVADLRRRSRPTRSFKDKRYGIPAGTDGRVLYFNKKLFAQAGAAAPTGSRSLVAGHHRRGARSSRP